jgi:hypothetical protein
MIRELSGAVERTAQVCEFRQGLSKANSQWAESYDTTYPLKQRSLKKPRK